MKKSAFILLSSALFLLLVGLVMLHPTESTSLRYCFWRQVALTVAGLAMMLGAAFTDYRIWQTRARCLSCS